MNFNTNRLAVRMAGATAIVAIPMAAAAVDVEVTHWWTSGGEAAAAAELASAFEERTDHTWVDGAIGGSINTARPVIISRILGGDPMAATQLNHGQQALELIEAGMMLDLTELAEEENWAEIIRPASLLEACTVDGRIYCAPLNIHSPQWMWTSIGAFEEAGLEPVTDWTSLVESAPALREAGIQPLVQGAQGWQYENLFAAIVPSLGGRELYMSAFDDKDEDVLRGEEFGAMFDQLANAREMARGSNVQDWNLATNAVINDTAAAQVMGDWAQGEFQAAGEVAGEDYNCFVGFGENQLISTAGDAIYFPVTGDEEVREAQLELASTIVAPETQVAFNLKKGSLPVRGDVDLESANSCMQKGLEVLAAGNSIPSVDILYSPDSAGQVEDLLTQFFASDMSPDDAQQRFADILLNEW